MGKKKNGSALPPKVIGFDGNDPDDQRLYHLLDRTRYIQSKFIKQLLSDFYEEFNITEETPYEDLCYIVKAYINKDNTYSQYKVLSQIINRGMPTSLPPDISSHTTGNDPSPSQTDKEQVAYSSADEEADEKFLGTMTSGFDSLLGD